MQRAFIELLKGHFLDSIKTYPALLPTAFLLAYMILHLIFKFEKGALILKFSFIFTVIIMLTGFILKIFIY